MLNIAVGGEVGGVYLFSLIFPLKSRSVSEKKDDFFFFPNVNV